MVQDTGEVLVKINGAERAIPPGRSVRGVLEFLGIDAERVAVELDRRIVRKSDWEGTVVGAGAEIEIVMFVGGG